MKAFRIIFVSLVLFVPAILLKAEDRDTLIFRNLSHSLELNLRPSYIMPTHSFYVRHNSKGTPLTNSASAHFQYSFTFSPESRYGRLYPDTYQGIGVGAYTFGCPEDIGYPLAVYVFQGGTILPFSKAVSLGYEWNFGISTGWHRNVAIISGNNAYINVALLLKWKFDPHWSLVAGPEYSHFSNGDTKYPNGGANTVGIRLGVKADINPRTDESSKEDIASYENSLRSKTFFQRVSFDIMAYGAWRADRMPKGRDLYIINEPFPLAGVQINPLYRFTRNICAGASLDVMYDGSANLYGHVTDSETDQVISYIKPSFFDQVSAGVSLRGELTMPVFSVNIGAGCNFYMKGSDMQRIYAVFDLKTFVSPRIFLLVGYRLSSLQYTHNLKFGLGYRI